MAALRDTTLRSVIFGMPTVTMTPGPGGQMTSKKQVDAETFGLYDHVLKVMAQLVRIVYCDSGIIQRVLVNREFGTPNNAAVNNLITSLDNDYLSLKRQRSTYPESKEGRPMESYVITPHTSQGASIAKYISSPSDLTMLIVKGSTLKMSCPFFQDTDAVIVFKGSSTAKNFKHDLYSQFTAADLSTLLPPGTSMSTKVAGRKDLVCASFVKPILKSWEQIKSVLNEFKPTRLFVTGHSLGGAYSSLFTFLMAEIRAANFPTIESIHNITFGAPTIVTDGARNTFNAHLDGGKVTLDRIVSAGYLSKLADIIPAIPVGFSHPGFQPLRTEWYPELKTGRAYTYGTVKKVYQVGGLFGLGSEKTAYEAATKTHMPNKVAVLANHPMTQPFAHAEYLDMMFMGAFRMPGMLNAGFKSGKDRFTFVADLFPDGVSFKYVPTGGVEEPGEIAPEAVVAEPMSAALSAGAPATPSNATASNAAPANSAPGAPVAPSPTRRRRNRRRQTRRSRR
jgi:hypothetical protein